MRLVPTTKLHTVQLALTMRDEDALECKALGRSRIDAVYLSWRSSDWCRTLVDERGEVLAIAGIHFDRYGYLPSGGPAQVWLLTARGVEQRPMALHRAAKEWLREVDRFTRLLWQHVDARYERSLRWVQALGFTVRPSKPHGPFGVHFHLVHRGRV